MADFSHYGKFSDEFAAIPPAAPPPEMSVEKFRQLANEGREKVSAEVMKSLAPSITQQDYQIPTRDGATLEARTYRSKTSSADTKLPIYIHLHGGGFLLGSLSSEDAACARISIGQPVLVLNVNYRHTPEAQYPTAYLDAEDAYEWAFTNASQIGGDGQRIILGGISAGSSMSAALAQKKLREQTSSSASLAGQILMIPYTVHPDNYDGLRAKLKSPEVSSYVQNKDAPVLPVWRIAFFNDLLFKNGKPAYDDRTANPGNATREEVKGLAPAVFGIAGADPLRDEGLFYAELLKSAGVPTDVHVFQGVPHGFRRYGAQLKTATAAWDRTITDGIAWILSRPQFDEASQVQVH